MKMSSFFKNNSLLLLLLAIIIIFSNEALPLPFKSFILALSLCIKDLLIFCLPALMASLIFQSTVSLAHNATRILTTIILAVCASNFLATSLSHIIARCTYNLDFSLISPSISETLQPTFSLNIQPLISNDIALFIACFAGLFLGKRFPEKTTIWAKKAEMFSQKFLSKINLVIPVFFAGFFMKIIHEKSLFVLWEYTSVLGVFVFATLAYIFCLFLLGSKNISSAQKNMRALGPSLVCGFTTMSSAATLPMIIKALSPRVKNQALAKTTLPSIINIHLLGDCFTIPILSFAILKSFGAPMPSFESYLFFTMYFVIAKFSVAGIPGGGIFVMLPFVEKFLGLTTPMLALCTALYLLFDPIITVLNILGNSAFTLVSDRFLSKSHKSSHTSHPSQ